MSKIRWIIILLGLLAAGTLRAGAGGDVAVTSGGQLRSDEAAADALDEMIRYFQRILAAWRADI